MINDYSKKTNLKRRFSPEENIFYFEVVSGIALILLNHNTLNHSSILSDMETFFDNTYETHTNFFNDNKSFKMSKKIIIEELSQSLIDNNVMKNIDVMIENFCDSSFKECYKFQELKPIKKENNTKQNFKSSNL